MISPQGAELSDAPGDPAVQAMLKTILRPERERAAAAMGMLEHRGWWVSHSHAACGGCARRLMRCSVNGAPGQPFYVCLTCGTVETLRDLSR